MIKKSKNFGSFEVFKDDFIRTRIGKKEISHRKYKCVFLDTGGTTYAGISEINSGQVRDPLYPIKSLIGEELDSTQDGKVLVCPEVFFNEKLRRNTYKVKFIETGNCRFFTKKEILTGKMKDLYKKRILGIACIGNASKKNNRRLYAIWYQMLKRCYDKNSKYYKRYGAKGVTVSEEWKCFETFLETLKEVPNFNLEKIGQSSNDLQLDKDLLQLNQSNKVYSKDTCIFLSNSENIKVRDLERALKKIEKCKDIVQSLN